MKHMAKDLYNDRVLVIDDEETVRDSFREILVPRRRDVRGLERASSALFDDGPPAPRKGQTVAMAAFDLTEAATGLEGLEAVKRAVAADAPFAAIFVDMRMPGWDGLRTVEKIREIDARAEIILVTAYSDFGIDEVVQRAGMNVSYHCKPFSVEEIRQIAAKAVYEWNRARNLEELIEVISHFRAHRWELDSLLWNILRQTGEIVRTPSAMLAEKDEQTGRYRRLMGIGDLADPAAADARLEMMPELSRGTDVRTDGHALFRVGRYVILTLLEGGAPAIDKERIYLARLFLEQAALAIDNVDLQETLIRREKLSAVGQAISMLAHDLRGPIGGICQGIEMLEAVSDDPVQKRDLHRMLLNEARRSLSMVNDLLDFTRNAPMTKSPVDVAQLLAAVSAAAASHLDELGIPLRIKTHGVSEFNADESKVRRILLNLVLNAAEALHGAKTPDPRIALSAGRENDAVIFRVADNGPGIPEAIRDKLFVPFVTGGKCGGTGLGLTIVEQFATAHGGNVDYATSPEGTVFTVWLPWK